MTNVGFSETSTLMALVKEAFIAGASKGGTQWSNRLSIEDDNRWVRYENKVKEKIASDTDLTLLRNFRAALEQIAALRGYQGEDMGRVAGYRVAAEIAEAALGHHAIGKPTETRCQDCDGYNCDDGCAYPAVFLR